MSSNKKKEDMQKSFELFLHRHRDGIFRSLRIWSKNHHLAEDLCQETFARAFEDMQKRGSPKCPKSYLRRIAKNLWIDHCRAGRGKENPNSNLHEWVCERAGDAYGNDTKQDPFIPASNELHTKTPLPLKHFLSQLPSEEQHFLKYFYLEGRSCWEIAILNGLSVGSARMRIHRARRKLQNEIFRTPIRSWTCSPRDFQTQTIQKGMTNDSFSDSENSAVLVG